MRPLLAVVALLAFAAPATAQRYSDDTDAAWLENCRRSDWNGDRGRACEVRAVPVRLTGLALEIDGRQNGSIRVVGWDGDSVRVTARVQSNAPSDEQARAVLADVKISADGRRIRADGPSTDGQNRTGWGASYVVYVPHRFDLGLEAHNGSIRVADVRGKLDLSTENGSVTLTDVAGSVHARTTNGSLNVQLAGARWDGSGLDAETTNGSVRLSVPEHYSAQLETGTVNGRINTDFPITVRGHISHQLSIPLNGGGTTVRAMTTNGSVTISTR